MRAILGNVERLLVDILRSLTFSFLAIFVSVAGIAAGTLTKAGETDGQRYDKKESASQLVRSAKSGQIPWNHVGDEGKPAYLLALMYGSADDLASYLESEGADANAEHDGLPLIFHIVGNACEPEKLEVLLKAGANPNAPVGVEGIYYPVMAAVANTDLTCFDMLIEYSADPRATDNLGANAYWSAVDWNNKNGVIKLYELGVDLFQKDHKGFDVVHYAVIMKKSDLLVDVLARHWNKTRDSQ